MTQLKTVVYQNAEQVAGLRPAWDGLLDFAQSYSGCQTYDYVMCAWELLSKTRGAKLAIVTVWSSDELVGVWPLYTYPTWLGVIACHLGGGSLHEYAGPIVKDGAAAPDIAKALYAAARGLADVLHIHNVRAPSAFHDLLSAQRGFKRTRAVDSPVVLVEGVASWDAWLEKKSRSFRQGMRADRKKLAGLGDLRFTQRYGPIDGPVCADWLFARKREFLAGRDLTDSFIFNDQPHLHARALASRDAPARGRGDDILFHTLTLDDEIIAASMCVAGSDRFEFYIMSVNPKYAPYSPGSILTQECLTMAIERGAAFDFRITRDAYKMRWVDGSDRYESFFLPCTRRGQAALFAENMELEIRALRTRFGKKAIRAKLDEVMKKLRKQA